MGDTIAAAFGPIAVPTGGEIIWNYVHPPDGKPSRVGLIAAHLSAGTQTGKLCIRYGADVGSALEIHKDVFTANDPSVAISPNLVIQPGQVIRIWIWDVTAGDIFRAFIEGH
jgi:hypothetical protein